MLIDSSSRLREIVSAARHAPAVALDTEFVWERTYYPRLGVVQMALSGEEVFLLDAAALDLSPLGDIIADASITKILHDARQDLVILRRATGAAPTNVFDTQVAAGFVGLGASNSLQNLVADVTGITLPKGATRSDWLKRPLSDEQLKYAADDVVHMHAVYDELSRRLEERGRAGWAAEEMSAYDDPSLYQEDDPRERYRSIRGGNKRGFGPREFSVLREVTAWREREARSSDRPRGHVVDDSTLAEIAQRKPASEDDLRRIRGLSDRAARRYGGDIVEAVSAGLDVPKEEMPARPARTPDDPAVQPRIDLVQALIRGTAERQGIDPTMLATRSDIESLVTHMSPNGDHPIFRGWRGAFIGEALRSLMAGRASVTLDADGLPKIVDAQ